ncbi:transketolase family protein, partial [Clostridioides sp. ZZV14-6045]|nr:transketolase family protein [Clostridioides sp. ZZV14-6045]
VAYPNLNVKIAATHAGVTVGEDGGSHQAIEDISLMRGIPNMVVLNPADALEARQALFASIDYNGPVYIRLGRAATPDVNSENYKFEIGKGTVLREGSDITVIATGIMVAKALEAAEELAKEGVNVEVVNISTIKPLDETLIKESAKKTGKVVTAEEHSIIGGLGSAVCEALAETKDVVVRRIGVKDVFGQSGTPADLLKHYGLTTEDIVKNIKELL